MLSNLIDIERIIHSFKTLIACLIGVALAKLSNLPSGQWIVITICVVMCSQLYVGSVLQKSYLRFLGTLVGCLFAIIAILISPNSHVAVLGAIAVSTFFFSYIATGQENLSYTGTLGAVTTVIIMLNPQAPTMVIASERFLEISIGILVASLVSQFVFPIHARTHLRRAQAKTLAQLRDYFIAATNLQSDNTDSDYSEMDEKIAKSLLRQRQLAKESAREPMGVAFNPEHFSKTLSCEREMLRSITFIHEALVNLKPFETTYLNSPAVLEFKKELTQGLNDLIQALEKDSRSQDLVTVPSLDKIKAAMQPLTLKISRDEQIYADGLLFSTEILTRGLSRLAELYHLRAMPIT